MRRRPAATAAVLLLMGALLVGCSSSDDSSTDARGPDADEEQGEADGGAGTSTGDDLSGGAAGSDGEGTADERAGDMADDDRAAGDDRPDSGAGSGSDGDPDEFCTRVAGVEREIARSVGDFDSIGPNDPAAVEDALEQLTALYRGIEPPAEIAEAWRISTSMFDPGSEVDPAELDQQTITDANDAVQTYLRDVCGIAPQ